MSWTRNLSHLQSEERLEAGYVIILPGIEGRSIYNRQVARGLAAGDVPYAIEIHDWTRRILGMPRFFYNLRSRRLHEEQATAIAAKITDYQRKYPHRPVDLIGHSGGGGMTALVAEALPRESSISGIVMLGAALSPHYRLGPALRHIDRKIWSFSSVGDFFFLGAFTAVCGTIDGRHLCSAGMVGFRCHELEDEEREKFEEIPYRAEFLRDQHFAGHFGCTSSYFVKRWVAPLLTTCTTPSEAIIDELSGSFRKAPVI